MKILIAVDESSCSNLAFQSVLNRRWSAKSEFKIISVVEPLVNQCVGWYSAYVPVVMIEAERELLKMSRKNVENKVSELKKAFPANSVSGEVLSGYVWRTIVDEASRWKADLIIVGSHGRSGFSKLFLGSVASAVAEHAGCSVEIIKGHAIMDDQVA